MKFIIIIKKKIPNSDKYLIPTTNDLSTNLMNLHNTNYNLMNSSKQININIGGDHSMSIGSVSATLNKYGSNTKVIWIDAHADINTQLTSPSGNVHGMPLGFLTGLDKSNKYNYVSNLLKFKNLCYIGIRDLDMEEIDIIKKYNIKTILSHEFNSNTNDITNDLIKWCGSKKTPIHLSIDVDSLEPKYMEFTGTKSPNGLELDKLVMFIKKFCSQTNIVNVDLAELNLHNPDCNNLSLEEQIKSFNNFNVIVKSLYNSINI